MWSMAAVHYYMIRIAMTMHEPQCTTMWSYAESVILYGIRCYDNMKVAIHCYAICYIIDGKRTSLCGIWKKCTVQLHGTLSAMTVNMLEYTASSGVYASLRCSSDFFKAIPPSRILSSHYFITQEHRGGLTSARKKILASHFCAYERSCFEVKVIDIKLSHDAKSAHGDCLP